MEISAIVLEEEELREAVSAWLKAKLGKPLQATYCKQVKSKGGRQFAVGVLVEGDAGCDSIPEEG